MVGVWIRVVGVWTLALGFGLWGWGLDSGMVNGAQGFGLNLDGWVLDS